jgi:glutamate formiminotransferase
MLGATVAPAKIAILTTEIAGITNLKTLKDKIQYFIANDDDLKSKNIRDKIKITN